jgi:hypothetical protein
VRGRVPLEWDRALRRDKDTADTLGDEGSKEVVHRQERKPQPEILTDAEHVDLLGLVDRQIVEQAAGGLRGLDASLPASSLRRHLRLLIPARGTRPPSTAARDARLARRGEKLGEP